MVVDNKVIKLREQRDPAYYRGEELKKKIEVFYDIYDLEWVEWSQKLFWRMFSIGMPAENRIKEIETIQNKIIVN